MINLKNLVFKAVTLIFIVMGLGTRTIVAQSKINYGLSFASHEVNKDERTSLNLSPKSPVTLKGDFTISFDINFRRRLSTYGFIFRLIGNDSKAFDFLANSFTGKGHDLLFVESGRETKAYFDIDSSSSTSQSDWMHVDFTFNRGKQQVSVSLNGKVRQDKIDLTGFDSFHLFFGANDYKKFSTSDVPPMSIRNIKIRDNDRIIRHWELKQHLNNQVVDLVANEPTEVKNASWIMDTHTRWQRKLSFKTSLHPQIAFQADSGIIHIAGKDSLYSYLVAGQIFKKSKYNKGTIIPVWSNQLIYHPFQKKLIQYDFESNRVNKYDFETSRWLLNDQAKQPQPAYWHHNAFISPVDSSLIAFGGYGFFTYKNSLQQFNFQTESWKKIDEEPTIMPRYLSASGAGKDPSRVYIFGGYGNESGKQQLSPENLYDFHLLDLKNFTFRKIWEIKATDNNFVVANSLKIDIDENMFYALCFPRHKSESYLFLGKFSLQDPEFTIVGDSIPYPFQDTQSYADLYYSQQTNELFAITAHFLNEKQAEVNIYSIAFPVIAGQMVAQNTRQAGMPTLKWPVILLLIICALSLTAYFIYRKKQPATKPVYIFYPEPEMVLPFASSIEEQPAVTIPIKKASVSYKNLKKQSVLLLGGLRLINKIGKDTAGNLTPVLQHLFTLILLFSVKNSKGISSSQMKDILWFDKSEESARNNRGVNIRKLRLLLEEIGEVIIISENNNWKVELTDSVFCDYTILFK